MRYFGSKAAFIPILQKMEKIYRKSPEVPMFEPFCGAGAPLCIHSTLRGIRYAGDINPHIISMWRALKTGWQPPLQILEGVYNRMKDNPESFPPEVIGFAGVACSFSGTWFGSYSKQVKGRTRNFAAEARRNLMKDVPLLGEISFHTRSYDEWVIPPKSFVYCDPPYAGSAYEYYGEGWDEDPFWKWADRLSRASVVVVSEYKAPKHWTCIWKQIVNCNVSGNQHTNRIEKLFVHQDNVSFNGDIRCA